jgi:hypothetical protein
MKEVAFFNAEMNVRAGNAGCQDLSAVWIVEGGTITLTQSGCNGQSSDGWAYTVEGTKAIISGTHLHVVAADKDCPPSSDVEEVFASNEEVCRTTCVDHFYFAYYARTTKCNCCTGDIHYGSGKGNDIAGFNIYSGTVTGVLWENGKTITWTNGDIYHRNTEVPIDIYGSIAASYWIPDEVSVKTYTTVGYSINSTSNNTSPPCPSGIHLLDGVCWSSACPAGQQFDVVARSCTDCPTGKYQDQNNVNSVTCKFCAAGKAFVDISNVCSDCGNGGYQDQSTVASAVCSTCAAGQYALSMYVSACDVCETGKFQELEASIEYTCKFCDSGKQYVSTTNACADCDTGMYQIQYQELSATCKFCVAGKAFYDASHVCGECGIGWYQGNNTAASVVCSACAAGQFIASATGTACGACETGKFQELQASIEYTCKFCESGTQYVSTTNACADCDTGQYQDQNNALSATCKFCVAGKGFVDTSNVCSECGIGQYQGQNNVASVVCNTCVAGQFVASATGFACGACETGKFQELAASIEYTCKFCVAGKQYVSTTNA